MASKEQVRDFWEAESCGERYGDLEEQARIRYELEPYIFDFARFEEGAGRDVLEVGVGMGADHLQWAMQRPRRLVGIDMTQRAVGFTCRRLFQHRFVPEVRVADAENLPFEDNSFDIVYSWGVLHHSPNTAIGIREVRRVLRPGGVARVMIYHTPSLVGLMLWTRYAALVGKPFTGLRRVTAEHLESPGTKAYSIARARDLFRDFVNIRISVSPGPGDLLLGKAGERHGAGVAFIRKLWPRWLITRCLPRLGLTMMIEASK